MKIAKIAQRFLKSSWTRIDAEPGERHWMVVDVRGPDGLIVLEAVLTKSRIELGWKELENPEHWRPGWHPAGR